MLKLGSDELQRIRTAVDDKMIFLLVAESYSSGAQYLNILVGALETPHISFLYKCPPLYHVHQTPAAFFKQLTMLLDLLEPIEIFFAFYCLMLQNVWWPQAQF